MSSQNRSSGNNAESLKDQGNKAFKEKDYTRALQFYTQALQANPQDKKLRAVLHSNRAQVYLVQKEYVKAEQEATRSIDIDSQQAKAHCRRADARMKLGKYEQALFDYRMTKQLDARIDVRRQMQEAYQKNREAKRKDYYQILGVKKDATAEEIKKRYQKLAKELHPDKVQDPVEKEQKTKQFQEVKEAYEKLKDPESRRKHDLGATDDDGPGGMETEFDAGGAADFSEVFKVFTSGGPFGFATMRGSDGFFTHQSPAGGDGFPDMFSQLFASMNGARMQRGGAGAHAAAGGPQQQFFQFQFQ